MERGANKTEQNKIIQKTKHCKKVNENTALLHYRNNYTANTPLQETLKNANKSLKKSKKRKHKPV